MKSVPLFVLCAAAKAGNPEIRSSAALFQALSQFQAHASTIQIQEEPARVQTVARDYNQDRNHTVRIIPPRFGSFRLTERMSATWLSRRALCLSPSSTLSPQ